MCDDQPQRKNIVRRFLGVLVALAPFALAAGCASSSWVAFPDLHFSAYALIFASLSIGVLNVYLTVGRPMLHRMRGGTDETYQFVSGLPVIGSACQVAGVILGFGNSTIGILGIIAAAVDMGGLPWFVKLTWNDSSFWDA